MRNEYVKDIEPSANINYLTRQMRHTAFNGRRLGEAIDIIEEMVKEEGCFKILGLAGALIPAGMRGLIVEMLRNGWVDLIVSTGANVTHDLTMAFGEKFHQTSLEGVDDVGLKEGCFLRIYDVYSTGEAFTALEKGLRVFLNEIKDGEYATYELMEEVGRRIDDEGSVLRNAYKHKVRIVVPAITDSIIGLQIWTLTQTRRLKIDPFKDLGYIVNLQFDLRSKKRKTGAIILGGGVPKNYIMQSALIAEKPFNYAIQITTDVPEFGGLSGATLEEAKSWGKIDRDARTCTLYCDVTIALPLAISALKDRLKHNDA